MNYYKCELGHEQKDGVISLCDSCIVARENQRVKLLEFVKDNARVDDDIYALENSDDYGDNMLAIQMKDARQILRKIGELECQNQETI